MDQPSPIPMFLTPEPPVIVTGIGSRKTPGSVQQAMTQRARLMTRAGVRIRTGGAPGADAAFLAGADPQLCENYIPFDDFEGYRDGMDGVCIPKDPAIQRQAESIAQSHHPAWERCSQGARLMHTRNVYQVLGADLQTPTDLVVCWTPGGALSGGTAMALRIAQARGIPIENIGDPAQIPLESIFLVESEQAAYRNLATPEHADTSFLPKSGENALPYLRREVRDQDSRGRWLRDLGDRVAYGEWVALVGDDMDNHALDAMSTAIRGLALQRRRHTAQTTHTAEVENA